MSERILVVDDEPALRLTLQEALASEDYRVYAAADGAEARKIVESSRLTLVLLDLRLPDVEGLDLLRWILDRRPDLPVVMITAYSTIETAVAAMRAGAADFLPKPFTPAELRETVARALKSREASRSRVEYTERIERARDHLLARDATGAEAHARAALAIDPSRGEALNLLGIAASVRRETALAANYFRAALAVDPTFTAAERNLRWAIEGTGPASGLDLGKEPKR
jgi:DNA-binding NtrC family response regulator